jgi:hypothetical protein
MALIKRIGAATLGVIQSFAGSGDLVITIGANTSASTACTRR